jgi:septum site-determining protein MinD
MTMMLSLLLRRSPPSLFARTFATTTEKHHPFVLSHPSTVDSGSPERGRIVCVTSGKGGVGKTTAAASFSMGLALRGKKTCVVDFDIGLRNLDIHLGCERRVIFDFVNVLMGECQLHQALLRDKREPNLSLLAASQTRDKESLTVDGVEAILADLCRTFDYVVLDSPAGIESGAKHSMYFCDDAILVVNPELSSCRDADKMVGFIASKSRRAELGQEECQPVQQSLLINRYDPARAEAEESLAIADIEELLGLPVVGVIPGASLIMPD